ncbi:MAG: hypothetical protein HKN41_11790, partial [Ilumatobacter sp.]|nr:hypothetical protein [Ilumatobacter sp.]
MLLTSFLSWLRQAPRPVIDVVDDPEGSIRLVRLRGPVTSAALLDLLEAGTELGAPRRCHVDLFDARITAAPIMR